MIYLVAYLSMLIGAISTVIAITAMRRREKHNIGKFGWLVLVLLTPPVGLILFALFGGRKISAEHKRRQTVQVPAGLGNSKGNEKRHRQPDGGDGEIAVKRGIRAPSTNNTLRFVTTPETMYRSLIDVIKSAQERLFVQSFIFVDDSLGRLSRFAYSNFRNHRTLVVADGNRAMLGGANFVEYEMTETPAPETWVDYLLEVRGDAARQAEGMFLSDWDFVTDEGLEASDTEIPRIDPDDPHHAKLQLLPVGADGPDELLDDVWLTAINRARERVWIATPYFVPPPMAMRSLAMAVRRGVDVRVLYPDESDLAPADFARFDYVRDLHHLGGRMFRLPEKMIHAKLLLVDDREAYVGSANFDMRSFFLNYEMVLGVFTQPRIDELADWFEDLSGKCIEGCVQETVKWRVLGVLMRVFGEEL
ncbi:phospholipase D-like domain-containing protein [Neorhodopirellula pilleata]|uniref:Putative cardiolipin synthase YwiE n=1 Tax=Neorhodopirellula pilleata TaxID=2714738 RepID=A0A5C6A6Q5_9BACT|nr:phospholipase D-like domain-containing protein [Neorhodopirellula pilleata]TWT95080.1 putative cardiolipin synthase YwiE [Neorhodopirellula pilleata]